MMQALAMAVYGNEVHFGLTLEQAMAPTSDERLTNDGVGFTHHVYR